MAGRWYEGYRLHGGTRVIVGGDCPVRELRIADGSMGVSGGWQWGGLCQGTYYLAAALLADCIGVEAAAACWWPFSCEVLLDRVGDNWHLDECEIRLWLANRYADLHDHGRPRKGDQEGGV
jgi:hypothetical protein